ncbi:MAG: filamentous hemagglutinin N-terminal domain-containing protein [Limnobacter sp.]|nr:filamentous hemagglutinin N-terminal domain-containing protein [Limnobacter sp.]
MNQNTLLPFSLSPLLVSLFALFTPFTTHAAGPAGLPGPGQLPADVAGQFKLERDVPGKSLTVTQERQGVLVDWNKLGVGASEVLNFVAKNPAANVSQWFTVNRVTGGQESTILGTVNAPWRIFLINPNGIVFGPGSSMNVGALVASTLKLGNADTLLADGEAQFELPTGTVAELRFEGTVQASDTVFVGPKVRFDGVVHPSVNAGAPNSANVYILATDSANIATTGTPVADGSPDESLRFLAVTDAGLELLKLVIQRSGNGTYSALNVPDVPAPGKLEVRNGNVFVQYAPASPVQVGQVATHTLVAQADATTSLVVNTQSNLLNSSISNAHSATTTAGGSAGLSTTDVTTVDATGTTGLSLTATRASQISGKTTGLGANVQINLTDADSANITSTGNITGTATDTSNTAGDALILNAEGTIGVTANHIQIAQLTTAGNILSSSISNASSATLHAGGDILGSSVSNASIASLVAGNDVNASANHVDTLSINAGQSIEFGQSRTIGKLTAVAQNAITQTGDVRVSGSDSPAILSANSIVLGNNGNVFAGGVLVQQHTAGQSATVHALGNLNARLNGQYSTVDLQAGNTLNADFQQADQAEVAGNTVNLSSTTNQLNIGTSLKVQADSGFDLQTTLHNAGSTRIAAQNARVLQADSTFDGLFNVILAGGRLDFAATGNVNLALSGANAADIRLSRGSLHQAADASGVVEVGGPFLVNVTNGNIDLTNPGNHFTGQVQLFGDQTSLSTQGDLNLAALQTKGGVVSAAQRLFLTGNIVQTGGALAFVAAGAGSDTGLQTAADLVLPELDVLPVKKASMPTRFYSACCLPTHLLCKRVAP